MKLFNNVVLLLLLLSWDVYSKSTVNIPIGTVKDLSLKECLDINYSKLGLYDYNGLNDESYFFSWIAIDNKSPKISRELKNFIKKETSDYYISKPRVKDSESNMIFILCMRFYKSRELQDYIEKNVLN